jgi:hypothetical protein
MAGIAEGNVRARGIRFILHCNKIVHSVDQTTAQRLLRTENRPQRRTFKRKIMKRLIPVSLLLATAIATGSAIAAPATADSCVTIARQLSQKTGQFVKVNADGRNAAQPANARPADFYRSLGKRDGALQNIANDVWTLRADMANRNCSQAAAFTY